MSPCEENCLMLPPYQPENTNVKTQTLLACHYAEDVSAHQSNCRPSEEKMRILKKVIMPL